MSKEIVVLVIQIAIALIFGYFVAHKSNVEKPIKGGVLAQIFHYLGAAVFVSVAPTVLLNAFVLRTPFLNNILLAVATMAVAMLSLILYAVFEAPTISAS
jgi:hypothetical protein